jgi:thioredoxin-like negative regulator of GroEL
LARVNPARITADMVDAASFPTLSARFGVRSVPMTVVNGAGSVVGAAPESMVMARIREVAGIP